MATSSLAVISAVTNGPIIALSGALPVKLHLNQVPFGIAVYHGIGRGSPLWPVRCFIESRDESK